MVVFHKLSNETMDFSECIKNHSGDETLCYKKVDNEELLLSLYYPKDYKKGMKYPVFVFVHGGGWASHSIFPDQTGWAGDHLGYLARYYANKGYVSVSIDYRLMDRDVTKKGYELIDLYEDCNDAVKFLIKNSEKYGLDFDRSVVLGESAGGFLAGALATFIYRSKPVFKKAILVNAILDLLDSRWNVRVTNHSGNPVLKDKSIIEVAEFLSPAHNVSDLTPDTLLLHGVEDNVVFPRNSYAFHDEMYLHGKAAELHFIENTNHAFLLAEYMREKGDSLSAATIAVRVIDNWLRI